MNSLASVLSMHQKLVILRACFASLIIHLSTHLAKNILNNSVSLLYFWIFEIHAHFIYWYTVCCVTF